ncbi:MAG: sugar transferase, partial [Demequina sp.]
MSVTAPTASFPLIRTREMPLPQLLLLSDIFVVSLVMSSAHAVRFGWDTVVPADGPAGPPYAWLTAAIAALWVFQLGWTRSRDQQVLGEGSQEFQRVASASWLTFVVVVMLGFFTDLDVSLTYLLLVLPVGTVVILGYRAAWRRWLRQQRLLERFRERTVVAGPAPAVAHVVRRLRATSGGRFDVVGVCLSGQEGLASVADAPVLGSYNARPGLDGQGSSASHVRADGIAAAVRRVGADCVILAGTEDLSVSDARRLEWEIEDSGVGLLIAASVSDIAAPRVSISRVEGLPLMHVQAPHFSGPKRAVKGFVDRAAALAALIVAAVPMLAIAVAVKLTSDGPVFFRQERVGRDHQTFTMLKFRTMYVDAEQRRKDIEQLSDGNGVLFKMRDDPRVTSVGRMLRRYSLDELPQLFNVLRGDMSMVGPRPPLPVEVALWEESEGVARRQFVKPGITGLWQVSGRSDLSWEDSVRLDLHYTENWTMGLDAVILLRTV